VPGRDWSPAWVTWRYTDAYCGWAPLPPGCGWSAGVGLTFRGSAVSVGFGFGLGWDYYNFVAYDRLCDHWVHRHCVPRHEVFTVYRRSAVANHYSVGRHNTIVNDGIPVARVTAATRTEVRRVALRDVTSGTDAARHADRFERNGSSLAVFRPQAAPGSPRPQVVPVFQRQAARNASPGGPKPTASGFAERGTHANPSPGAIERARGVRQTPATSSSPAVRTTPRVPESPSRPATGTPRVLTPGRASDGTSVPAARPYRGQSPSNHPSGGQTGTGPSRQAQPPVANHPSPSPPAYRPDLPTVRRPSASGKASTIDGSSSPRSYSVPSAPTPRTYSAPAPTAPSVSAPRTHSTPSAPRGNPVSGNRREP